MDNSNYSLSYRKDLGIIVLRWKSKGNAESIVQSYLQMCNLAIMKDGGFWLLDLRGRELISLADAYWVKHYFFPAVEQKLNRKIYIAYLLQPSMLEYLWQNEGNKEDYLFNNVHTRVFTSEILAFGWLISLQRLTPSPPRSSLYRPLFT